MDDCAGTGFAGIVYLCHVRRKEGASADRQYVKIVKTI